MANGRRSGDRLKDNKLPFLEDLEMSININKFILEENNQVRKKHKSHKKHQKRGKLEIVAIFYKAYYFYYCCYTCEILSLFLLVFYNLFDYVLSWIISDGIVVYKIQVWILDVLVLS